MWLKLDQYYSHNNKSVSVAELQRIVPISDPPTGE